MKSSITGELHEEQMYVIIKLIRRFIIFLHFFTGIGACAGGAAAVLDPVSPMGMPVEALKNGPFTDFFIPGLFLLLVLGVGNFIAGIIAIKKLPFYGYTCGFMGAVLCAWIIIQCLIIQSIVFLHVLFFIIGAVQGLCALYILLKENLFPFNWLRK